MRTLSMILLVVLAVLAFSAPFMFDSDRNAADQTIVVERPANLHTGRSIMTGSSASGSGFTVLYDAGDCTGIEPPASGDWIVNSDTFCEDTGIILNGDLRVSSSILGMSNTTILFNNSFDCEYGMYSNGGNLTILDGSFISTYDQDYSAYMQVWYGNLRMEDSFLSRMGNQTQAPYHGLYARYVDSVVLKRNEIFDVVYAFILHDSDNPIIEGNRLYNLSGGGVQIHNCPDLNLIDNNISSFVGFGIFVSNVTDSLVSGNRIHNGTGEGMQFGINSNNVTIRSNTIYGVNSGIRITNTIHHNALIENNISDCNNGINLDYADNTNITRNNIFSNSQYGIRGTGSSQTYIHDNDVWDNRFFGMHFINFDDSVISSNDIYSNSEDGHLSLGSSGVYINISDNISVINNRLWDDEFYGLKVFDSSGSIIDNEIFSNNRGGLYGSGLVDMEISGNSFYDHTADGFFLSGCNDSLISGNSAYENDYSGFSFRDVWNLTVSDNTAENNSIGILMDNNLMHSNSSFLGNTLKGSSLSGMDVNSTLGDLFAHNSFSDNQMNMRVYSGDDSIFRNNTLVGGVSYSLFVSSTEGAVFDGNSIIGGGIHGIYIEVSGLVFKDNNVSSNGAIGINSAGSRCNLSGNTISHNDGAGVSLLDSYFNLTDNHIIWNAGDGVSLSVSNASLIGNHIIDNTGDGVDSADSRCNLSGNLIYSNDVSGVRLTGSSSSLEDNNITVNGADGVYAVGSGHYLIGNNISGNVRYGVYLLDSDFNLTGNMILGNLFYGVVLVDSYSNLTDNDINRSGLDGVYLENSSASFVMNSVSHSTGHGVFSLGSLANLTNSTLNSNGGSGIFNHDYLLAPNIVVLDNTICHNQEYAVHSLDAEPVTAWSDMNASNDFCSGSNIIGQQLQEWTSQVRVMDQSSNYIVDASVEVYEPDSSVVQKYSGLTSIAGITSEFMSYEYMVENDGSFSDMNPHRIVASKAGFQPNVSLVGIDSVMTISEGTVIDLVITDNCFCLYNNSGIIDGVCSISHGICTADYDIVIQSGGTLNLSNTTIYIDSSYPGEFGVTVQSGGTLILDDADNDPLTEDDASIITTLNPTVYVPGTDGFCSGLSTALCPGCARSCPLGCVQTSGFCPIGQVPCRPLSCNELRNELNCLSVSGCNWNPGTPGGYHKTGFVITADDGSSLLIKNSRLIDGGYDFGGSLMANLEVYTSDFVLQGNYIENAGDGVIVYMDGAVIEDNTFMNCSNDGIVLYSSGNAVTGNSVILSQGADSGIYVASSGNDISDNIVEYSVGPGIHLDSADSNNVTNNTVRYNDAEGILLEDSDLNIIRGNLMIENLVGINITSLSVDNIIHANTFQGNTLQASADNSSNLFYDNSTGTPRGNYWSDILAAPLDISDSDSDGYGDSGLDYPYNFTNGADVTGTVNDLGPRPVQHCGNGICFGSETCSNCPQDCGVCQGGGGVHLTYFPECPDEICNDGETCESCPQDCGYCPGHEPEHKQGGFFDSGIREEPETKDGGHEADRGFVIEEPTPLPNRFMGTVLLTIAILLFILSPGVMAPKAFMDVASFDALLKLKKLAWVPKVRVVRPHKGIKNLGVDKLTPEQSRISHELSKKHSISRETSDLLVAASKHFRPRVYTKKEIPFELKKEMKRIKYFMKIGPDGKISWSTRWRR
ncbi:right-handed parallel beta-helix repeat-containing protein [Candidatus Woesearchaeota archaeon]|nr:right-handed parallel beta-helix repeat-containing protein [Candidatus Woesearchaeota archaeon]